jgi:hypothetical protein
VFTIKTAPFFCVCPVYLGGLPAASMFSLSLSKINTRMIRHTVLLGLHCVNIAAGRGTFSDVRKQNCSPGADANSKVSLSDMKYE